MSGGTLIHIEYFINNFKQFKDMKKAIFILLLICVAVLLVCCNNTGRDVDDLYTMIIKTNGEVKIDRVVTDNIIPAILSDSTISHAVLVYRDNRLSNEDNIRFLDIKSDSTDIKINVPTGERRQRQYYLMQAVRKDGGISIYTIGDSECRVLDSLMMDSKTLHLIVTYITRSGKIGVFDAKSDTTDLVEEQQIQ